ncbi:MFS transporter [Streptosporangium saharense]|uniref:MFS transporter n=1 Tax=Streptosporangium saharense TaxID=1706840 RepID=UPI00331EFC6D
MLAPYRTILALPGALAFSGAGLLARMPASMMGLSLILLLFAERGSYALAGQVTASYVLLAAVVSPFQARLVDRHGQRAVLLPLSLVNLAAKVAMVLSVTSDLPSPLPHLCAAAGGATSPLVGAYARARWSALLGDRPELRAAYALESLVEDLCAVVGPPLATLLATVLSPLAGLVVAIGCGFAGTTLFAVQRRTQPLPKPRGQRSRDPLGVSRLGPVCLITAGLGLLSGSVNVTIVAFYSEQGSAGLSGLVLGAVAAASVLAALVVGAVAPPPHRLVRLAALATAVLSVCLPLVATVPSGAVVLVGVAVTLLAFTAAPATIATFTLVERLTPASRLSEAIAWTTSFLLGGYALGGALAGTAIDHFHAPTAFLIPPTAALVTACFAFLIPAAKSAPTKASGEKALDTNDVRSAEFD